MFSQLNDVDFIAQIERKFLSRKRTGCFLLIISLASIGAAGYFAYDSRNHILSITDAMSRLEATSINEAVREEAKKASTEFPLITGVTLGFIWCAAFTAGIHGLMHALYLIFDSRKERLLIEYSKRLQNSR